MFDRNQVGNFRSLPDDFGDLREGTIGGDAVDHVLHISSRRSEDEIGQIGSVVIEYVGRAERTKVLVMFLRSSSDNGFKSGKSEELNQVLADGCPGPIYENGCVGFREGGRSGEGVGQRKTERGVQGPVRGDEVVWDCGYCSEREAVRNLYRER